MKPSQKTLLFLIVIPFVLCACSVASGTGTPTANVTTIQVVCAPVFTISGSVSGLLGSGFTLQDNGGDNLAVSGTGNVNFTFATPLLAGATYAVTILTQPKTPVQTCTVVNGSGTVNGNVGNVNIICSQPAFSIGGFPGGLLNRPRGPLGMPNKTSDHPPRSRATPGTFPPPPATHRPLTPHP